MFCYSEFLLQFIKNLVFDESINLIFSFLEGLLTKCKDMAHLNRIAVFSFICLLCNVYGFINIEKLEPSNVKDIYFQLGSKLRSLGKDDCSDDLGKISF